MSKIVITGGAGFIGVNAALHFARGGNEVLCIDDLSRKGSPNNRDVLEQEGVKFARLDICKESAALEDAFRDADVVVHLAAQVAVTTSVDDPRNDFMRNLLGSFNVLEAARKVCPDAVLLYSSTNKVYGKLDHRKVVQRGKRYVYEDIEGVSEREPLDFYSPYGCSKGGADQYFLDYARIYGLKTVVFRQSCIYGPMQYGVEDQGWVAWFIIAAMFGRPLTIYGDGMQVRDVLHVADLIRAYEFAIEKIETVRGRAYNIGGGPKNTLSLLELVDMLNHRLGRKLDQGFAEWRPGDQKVFVCDVTRAKDELAWTPTIAPDKGIDELMQWVEQNKDLIARGLSLKD